MQKKEWIVKSRDQKVLFQKISEKWYAIIADEKTGESLFIALPKGVKPDDSNFKIMDYCLPELDPSGGPRLH